MSSTLPAALANLPRHFGDILICVCGPDATYRLLCMGVVYRDKHWWLMGYDEGELTEPLILDVADITDWWVE